MSMEARWPIRDGDRVGRGRESERLDCGNRLKKTGETVDCHQNNGSVKAVFPHHCPATCALRNCSFNCCSGQSQKQCLLHRCWQTTWTTQSKRRPTCSAQLHLPTHDLFWAKLRVQLHLPPLRSKDLLIFWSRLEPWRKVHTPRWRKVSKDAHIKFFHSHKLDTPKHTSVDY